MPLEIERRFLVKSDGWRNGIPGTFIRQGYLVSLNTQTLRVRLAGSNAYLTLKSRRVGLVRNEIEYPIAPAFAQMMLDHLCAGMVVEKTRHTVDVGGTLWEIDVFHGANTGLVIAEVELDDPNEAITLPDWVGEEISADRRYSNSSLARYPLGAPVEAAA